MLKFTFEIINNKGTKDEKIIYAKDQASAWVKLINNSSKKELNVLEIIMKGWNMYEYYNSEK